LVVIVYQSAFRFAAPIFGAAFLLLAANAPATAARA
jgi:hypothetical protein